jgi:hypothetical protein
VVKSSKPDPKPTDRRAKLKDRRDRDERRTKDVPVVAERRQLERRVKVNRRRQIDPTTCERDYSGEEIEFMQALEQYKRANGRMFPTCSEILEVIRDLGYQRVSGGELLAAKNEIASDTDGPQPLAAIIVGEELSA